MLLQSHGYSSIEFSHSGAVKVGGSSREIMRWSQLHCLLHSEEQHWVLKEKEEIIYLNLCMDV